MYLFLVELFFFPVFRVSLYSVCVCVCVCVLGGEGGKCVCVHLSHSYAWTLVDVYIMC